MEQVLKAISEKDAKEGTNVSKHIGDIMLAIGGILNAQISEEKASNDNNEISLPGFYPIIETKEDVNSIKTICEEKCKDEMISNEDLVLIKKDLPNLKRLNKWLEVFPKAVEENLEWEVSVNSKLKEYRELLNKEHNEKLIKITNWKNEKDLKIDLMTKESLKDCEMRREFLLEQTKKYKRAINEKIFSNCLDDININDKDIEKLETFNKEEFLKKIGSIDFNSSIFNDFIMINTNLEIYKIPKLDNKPFKEIGYFCRRGMGVTESGKVYTFRLDINDMEEIPVKKPIAKVCSGYCDVLIADDGQLFYTFEVLKSYTKLVETVHNVKEVYRSSHGIMFSTQNEIGEIAHGNMTILRKYDSTKQSIHFVEGQYVIFDLETKEIYLNGKSSILINITVEYDPNFLNFFIYKDDLFVRKGENKYQTVSDKLIEIKNGELNINGKVVKYTKPFISIKSVLHDEFILTC